jgi:putative ABC transport system permease protein
VLVVDPATAADGMTWRPEWAGGASLAELVSRLGPAAPDGTVPALQVGDLDPMTIRPDRLGSVRIVGRPSTFPAREHADGLLVISWDALAQADPRGFTRFVLSRDTPIDVVRAMEAAGEPTGWAATADGANDALPFLVVAWTFDFFVTLGLVLAAVAAAALLVSIEARRRATAVAHALLARMGLRVRSLYASYVAELAGLAVVSAAIGLSGGWLVLAVAGAKLDPAPYLSPTPVPVSLAPLAVLVVVVAAVLVALVAAVAVRAALRAPVRELLRG